MNIGTMAIKVGGLSPSGANTIRVDLIVDPIITNKLI